MWVPYLFLQPLKLILKFGTQLEFDIFTETTLGPILAGVWAMEASEKMEPHLLVQL